MKFLIVKSNGWSSSTVLVHNFPFTSMGKILALVMGSIILKETYTSYFFFCTVRKPMRMVSMSV